ncbi:hypothetical protein V8C44DRAFT_327242 [Trichoderma aethiopicum]
MSNNRQIRAAISLVVCLSLLQPRLIVVVACITAFKANFCPSLARHLDMWAHTCRPGVTTLTRQQQRRVGRTGSTFQKPVLSCSMQATLFFPPMAMGHEHLTWGASRTP